MKYMTSVQPSREMTRNIATQARPRTRQYKRL